MRNRLAIIADNTQPFGPGAGSILMETVDHSPTSLAHNEINPLLSRYLNRRLGRTERLRVENHLAECNTCKEDLGLLKTVARQIHASTEINPGLERKLQEMGLSIDSNKLPKLQSIVDDSATKDETLMKISYQPLAPTKNKTPRLTTVTQPLLPADFFKQD